MADCPRRIILPVNDGRLIAINAENGKLCETFANKGVLNLQSNMPDTKPVCMNRLRHRLSPIKPS